jgi:hypothetical protein
MGETNNMQKPASVLSSWLKNVKDAKTFDIKGDGQMLDSLRMLYQFGGYGRFTDIQHNQYHAREIQKCLILGLIQRVKKDCRLCPGRKGNKVPCLGTRKRCSGRYLYALTALGFKAVEDLIQYIGQKGYYKIEIEVSPYWWNYFCHKIW